MKNLKILLNVINFIKSLKRKKSQYTFIETADDHTENAVNNQVPIMNQGIFIFLQIIIPFFR